MAEPIKSYRDLIAWQKAFGLGKAVYELAGTLPEAEKFGLVASMRRLSVSIASHIANGYGRGNTADYVWFLKQARGEMYQLDTQLLFALDFKYFTEQTYSNARERLEEAEKVLAGLIKSLNG